MNLSPNSSQSLYGALSGAFCASGLVKITVPIFTSASRRQKIASKSTINELYCDRLGFVNFGGLRTAHLSRISRPPILMQYGPPRDP